MTRIFVLRTDLFDNQRVYGSENWFISKTLTREITKEISNIFLLIKKRVREGKGERYKERNLLTGWLKKRPFYVKKKEICEGGNGSTSSTAC